MVDARLSLSSRERAVKAAMAASIREALSSSCTMVEAWPSSVCQLWAAATRVFCLFWGQLRAKCPRLGLIADAVSSGGSGGSGSVVLEAAWPLSSVPLGPAEVHRDLCVVIGPRGVRGIVLILGAVSLVRLVRVVPLVVLGPPVFSEPLPISRSRGGALFQVSEGFECPSRAYALRRSFFYGGVIVDER